MADVSADGRTVAFTTDATNLPGGPGYRAVIRNLDAGTVEVFGGTAPCPTGFTVVLNNSGGRFMLERLSGASCADRDLEVVRTNPSQPTTLGPVPDPRFPSLSGDGRTVAWTSALGGFPKVHVTGTYNATLDLGCEDARWTSLSNTGRYVVSSGDDCDARKVYVTWFDLGEAPTAG